MSEKFFYNARAHYEKATLNIYNIELTSEELSKMFGTLEGDGTKNIKYSIARRAENLEGSSHGEDVRIFAVVRNGNIVFVTEDNAEYVPTGVTVL